MGLDVSFYRALNNQSIWSLNKARYKLKKLLYSGTFSNTDHQYYEIQEIINNLKNDSKFYLKDEIGYLRKAYFILDYFHYTKADSDMKISRHKLKKLLNECEQISQLNINNYDEFNDKAFSILNIDPKPLFFFNCSPYSAVKEEKIFSICIDTLKEILEITNNKDIIILNASW